MAPASSKEDKNISKPFIHGPATGPCSVCGKAGAQACSVCRVDFYCGKQHQKQDWPRHRKGCDSLVVRWDKYLGRYLEATKDIPAGTVLMREVPLVAFPVQSLSDVQFPVAPPLLIVPLCVGCCRSLQHAGPTKYCPRCRWPVCDVICSLRPEHGAECAAFQAAGFKFRGPTGDDKDWHALAALRVCLAMRSDAKLRARVQEMQSEPPPKELVLGESEAFKRYRLVDSMFTTFDEHCDGVAARLKRWKLKEKDISLAELGRVTRVIVLNALTFEHYLDPPQRGNCFDAGGLYAGLSLLEHSCVANAVVLPWLPASGELANPPGPTGMEMVLLATRDIRRGEHVSVVYGFKLHGPPPGFFERSDKVRRYCFLCRCPLCRDLSQAGMRMDAWHCGFCKGLGRQQLVRITGEGLHWSCDGCSRAGTVLRVADQYPALASHCEGCGDDLCGDDDTGRLAAFKLQEKCFDMFYHHENNDAWPMDFWERWMEKAMWPSGPLHPTHHVVLEVKREIVRQDLTYVVPPGPKEMEELSRRKAHCRDLLAVAEAVSPGNLNFQRSVCMRLYYFARTQLAYYVEKYKRQPSLWPQLRQHVQALNDEVVDVQKAMKTFTVTPWDKFRYNGSTGLWTQLLAKLPSTSPPAGCDVNPNRAFFQA